MMSSELEVPERKRERGEWHCRHPRSGQIRRLIIVAEHHLEDWSLPRGAGGARESNSSACMSEAGSDPTASSVRIF
ncbi:hypothetical protein ACFX2K_020118 [Malus domestica]